MTQRRKKTGCPQWILAGVRKSYESATQGHKESSQNPSNPGELKHRNPGTQQGVIA